MDNTNNLTPNNYLYHAGVKGMKWGVRKNKDGGGSSRSAGKSKPEKDRPKKTSNPRRNVKKGKRYVEKIDGTKVATVVSSTAAIASGVLWMTSAFVPGGAEITLARGALSAVGAAANLAGSMPTSQKPSRK
jgi:hypothetical protein